MNKEHVQLWVKALRSGAYKQATGALTRINLDESVIGHCCLGVACEVYQKEVGDLAVRANGGHKVYDSSAANLPKRVKIWLGGDILEPALVEMNDHHGSSFEQIADYIEETYLEGGEN